MKGVTELLPVLPVALDASYVETLGAPVESRFAQKFPAGLPQKQAGSTTTDDDGLCSPRCEPALRKCADLACTTDSAIQLLRMVFDVGALDWQTAR